MSTALRLLVVVPFGPRRDAPHGGRVVAQLLDGLADRHDVAVVYLDRRGDPPMDPGLAARCALTRAVPIAPGRWIGARWRHRLNVLVTRLTGRPTPVAAVYTPRLGRAVRQVAAQWTPDVIQVEDDALSYCLPERGAVPAATVLVSHDPGLRVSMQLAAITRGRQRLAHRLDAAAWRRFWSRALERVDAVVTFTPEDAEAVGAATDGRQLAVIPLGITIPEAPASPAGSAPSTVAFVGGYAHTPNLDAAERLMSSIMPQVRGRIPEARLMLVGKDPPATLRALAGAQDEITGTVESVAPYVDQASVIALPIRLGGGMRVKLLEALAAGKAVVASPVAAAGLDLQTGQPLVLAGTDDEFAAAISELLADEATRVELAREARRWATAHLSWDARRAEYEALYRTLLATASRRIESMAS